MRRNRLVGEFLLKLEESRGSLNRVLILSKVMNKYIPSGLTAKSFLIALCLFVGFCAVPFKDSFAQGKCRAPGPKTKLCRSDMCLSKEVLSKPLRNLIPKSIPLITLPRKAVSTGVWNIPPTTEKPMPLMKLPAERKTIPMCVLFTNGTKQCAESVQYGDCPKTILLADQESRKTYECDLTCSGPDGNGDCECDTVPNSCVPVG